MKKVVLFLYLSLLILNAQEWSAIGYGQTQKSAMNDALENLSKSIKTQVSSEFTKEIKESNTKVSKTLHSKLTLISELPLLGTKLESFKLRDSYEATATLEKESALPLYKAELHQEQKLLREIKKELTKKQNSTHQLELILKALAIIEESYSYNMVLSSFNEKTVAMPLNEIELKSQLSHLESNINSIKLAAQIITQGLLSNNESVYIYPPKAPNTKETTPFASVITKVLKAETKSVSHPKETQFLLRGSYETLDNQMVLHYALYDVIKRKNIRSKTIFIKQEAYKGLRTKALNIDFSSLLESGQIVTNQFQTMIKSNKGDSGLLYEEGEEIELFIRLNKTGYYYIVGYTQNDKNKFSYLLQLNDASGHDAFIKFVHADMANRWVSLGSFTIEPPYGIETLQIFASDQKINTIPPYTHDEQSGFYLIDKDITKGLSKTRAIMFKKSKKALHSEASLSFTTVEK